jgi:hypothetical protein
MDTGNAEGYRPGACNIGPEEIARRRRSAIVASAGTLGVAAAMVILGVPPVLRLLIAPFAAGAAVAWLQVTRRFCVAFGTMGVRNFGPLGAQVRVQDEAARSADRRRAFIMISQAVAVGIAIAAAFALLPL